MGDFLIIGAVAAILYALTKQSGTASAAPAGTSNASSGAGSSPPAPRTNEAASTPRNPASHGNNLSQQGQATNPADTNAAAQDFASWLASAESDPSGNDPDDPSDTDPAPAPSSAPSDDGSSNDSSEDENPNDNDSTGDCPWDI